MPKHGPRPTMTELASRYIERRRPQLAASTFATMRTGLLRFAAWWDGPSGGTRKVPLSMTESDVETYLWSAHECDRKAGCRGVRTHKGPGLRDTASDSYFNQELSRLRHFFAWAAREGEIRPEAGHAVSPDHAVRKKRPRRLRLNESQLRATIEHASDPWERAVVALCTFTAGRASEIASLRVGDVDLVEHEITWNRHKTGDDSDYMPIMGDLAVELERWFGEYERQCGPLRDDWYLVPGRTFHGPLPHMPERFAYYRPTERRVSGLYRVVKPHLAAVLGRELDDVKGEGVHTLRRSMSRALYERLRDSGEPDPIAVVQALLGHASRSMTERYIGMDSGREARDKFLKGNSIFGSK